MLDAPDGSLGALVAMVTSVAWVVVWIAFWTGCLLWAILLSHYFVTSLLDREWRRPRFNLREASRAVVGFVLVLLAGPLTALSLLPLILDGDLPLLQLLCAPIFVAVVYSLRQLLFDPATRRRGLPAVASFVVGMLFVGMWLSDADDRHGTAVGIHQGSLTRSPGPDLDREFRERWNALPEAELVIEHQPLTQGQTARLSASIVTGRPSASSAGGSRGGGAQNPQAVTTAPLMEARLSGRAEHFRITALSTEEQGIVPPQTEWHWSVLPLSGGELSLHIVITAKIMLSDGRTLARDVAAQDIDLRVEPSPMFTVVRFLRTHWQLLIGSPLVIAFVAWLSTRILDALPRARPKRATIAAPWPL